MRCIIGFMDGETLISFSGVSTRLWDMTTRRTLWKDAAVCMFPHLRQTNDASAYGGDWRMLVVDRNRRNRSMVFISRFARMSTDLMRRTGSSIIINDFSFHVIVDPAGNPNIHLPGRVVSAYIACVPNQQAEPDWECCCQFSLSLLNQKKGRNKTWHSTLPEHRFSAAGVHTWGIHEFISHTEMVRQGFAMDDTIAIRVRLQVLYMRVRVIRLGGAVSVLDVFRSTRIGRLRRMIGCLGTRLWVVCGASEPPVLLDDDDVSIYSLASDMMVHGLDEITVQEDGAMPLQATTVLTIDSRFLRLDHIVDFFRRCGGDPRRIPDVFFDRAHQDPIETLRYIMAGRNLGCCCDQCGAPDFIGSRYHCRSCSDYDLCGICAHSERILPYRYLVGTNGRFHRISGFHEHTKEHVLSVSQPLFYSK